MNKNVNLPNIITAMRLILTPVIILLFLSVSIRNKIIALTLFILCCLSDKLDGTIAKKYHQVTMFGSYFDPLVDKIQLNSILIMLALMKKIPLWMVVLVVSREILIQSLRTIALIKEKTPRAFGGKIKGPLQMALIIIAMYFLITNGDLDSYMSLILNSIMILILIVSYVAMGEFFIKNWNLYKEIFIGATR